MRLLLRQIKRAFKCFVLNFRKVVPIPVPVMYGELLQGRIAMVTGATSGIGKAIAISFLRNGADIIITGRNLKKIEAVLAEISSLEGGRYKGRVKTALLDNRELTELKARDVLEVLNSFGKTADILVNNAGILKGGSLWNVDSSTYDEVMNVNLRGTYFIAQTVAKEWMSKKVAGNMLNLCSSSSLRPAVSPYALSKWGMRALTSGLAKVLTPHGITVNGIAPGPTATPMLMEGRDESLSDPRIPIRRMSTVEEIANLAVVLVSQLGRVVCGDVLYATGGSGNLTVDDVDYN